MLYLAALGLTMIIEVPVYASVLLHGAGVPVRRACCAAAAVNLASHPLAFLVTMPVISPALGYLPALAVVEVGAWVLEALLLWVCLERGADQIGLAALLANAASLSVGMLLFT